jgi:hypothetical protein
MNDPALSHAKTARSRSGASAPAEKGGRKISAKSRVTH